MPARALALSPFRLIDRLRPAPLTRAALAPVLQTFGGLKGWKKLSARNPEALGRLGSLEVRLATKPAEVRRAQKLRYHVFYQQGSATPDAAKLFARRDVDAFDAICEHLLVTDHAFDEPPRRLRDVVGTYRLLRQQVAEQHGGFYTAGEFAIDELVAGHPGLNFLELGRSCVLPRYRNKRTVELLWHGIWKYVRQQRVDVMFGCASFDGTDPDRLAVPLSYLHHYARAPQEWQARALPGRYVEMNRLPKESIDKKSALRSLPPLIKGYLRVGAYIGDGAVIDHQFGTTDVLIVLPVSAINARYIHYFGADAQRRAA
jgi:L-ornithine Nalpha-acyltransferase